MTSRLGRLPLRVRLVAGFVVAMLVVLTAAGAFVYWRVQFALDRGLDTELDQASSTIQPLVRSDGTVRSVRAADATGVSWQVLDDRGDVLVAGDAAPTTSLIGAGALSRIGSQPVTVAIGDLLPISPQPYRARVETLGHGHFLLVAVRRDHRDEALRELLLQLALAGLAALVVTAYVGDRLARAALSPVERYRRRATEIAQGADGLRLEVPTARDDEITRLGHTLNDMLTALEQSLDHERRFVNDASHELRTPLTLLRSRIQLTRRRARSVEEHEAALDELSVDVDRLVSLADQLLALGATGEHDAEVVDLGRVVSAVVERRRLARPESAGDLVMEIASPAPRAVVDAHTLERVVTNLVENAFTHGRPPVVVSARGDGGRALLRVEDAGEGMTADLLASATARFTRADRARSRPGAGLGLALVEQLIARTHGELRLCCGGAHTSYGAVTATPCDHGDGMTVSVWWPRERDQANRLPAQG